METYTEITEEEALREQFGLCARIFIADKAADERDARQNASFRLRRQESLDRVDEVLDRYNKMKFEKSVQLGEE